MNNNLTQFLDEHIKSSKNTNIVDVFPIPCGVGKSEYITYLLADAIQNQYGLIVVTDMVDRLNQYTKNSNNEETEQLTDYINRNMSKISILSSANKADENKVIRYKPIIMMTTQRYFDYLSRDEIINFTLKQNIKRPIIIFDEKPYLLENRKITIKTLNDISTTLKEGLDNTINPTDKQWLINQYDSFNTKLQQKLEENEKLNNDTNNFRREVYFNSDGLTISEDDSKFNALIKKYKPQLNKYNPNTVKNIEAIIKLLFDGAVTSQKVKSKNGNQEYKNYFTIVTNNADKLINIGAKIFVLDGTADISPEYRLKCVNMINCSQFKRDLGKLTINIVNINTSKDRLTRKGEKTEHLIQAIIDYIKTQPIIIDTVFTYQSIEQRFKDNFANVNHFGNIKGSNRYREVNNICQVGLNRYSEVVYMLMANEIGQYNHTDRLFNHRIYDKETIDNIRCGLILSDIEQNLFRCKIRNANNTEECTYTLMCSISEKTGVFENYQPLVKMIKSRYEASGATVNIIDTPLEFKLLKSIERKQDTNTKKILDWLSTKTRGCTFHIDDMLSELNLIQKQFQKIKEKDASIKNLFENMKTNKRGYYVIK